MKWKFACGLTLTAWLILTACSSGTPTPPPGDPIAGESTFSSAGCIACHAVVPDVKIVGPSLFGVVDQVESLRPGYTADQYFYESITDPNIFITPGFQPDLMPKTFKDTLTAQDLADLIAYLKTLH